jgi:hypothetical protein
VQDLPSGTVTLLFTDIEGSTRLLEELGDAYAERRIREASGPDFDRGYAEGRELTLDDAVSSALE